MELPRHIFRAYDIRGIVTDNLTEEVVFWIARAFAAEALAQKQRRVVVGCDGRHSSDDLRRAVIRGLIESGCDAIESLNEENNGDVTEQQPVAQQTGLGILQAYSRQEDEARERLERNKMRGY